MKDIIQQEDFQCFTETTGDPFADIGGYVIKFLSSLDMYSEMDITELIGEIARIYVLQWGSKLNACFLNAPITQAAYNNKRKIEETVNYYKSLIEGTAEYHMGYCRITGRYTWLYPAGRDNYMLSGSGAFINFHHGFEQGLYLSKEVLIRIFFAPFGLMQLSGKIALMHSNMEGITQYFVNSNIKENLRAIGSNTSGGLLKSLYNHPANALFKFAEDCISIYDSYIENESGEFNDFNRITLNLYLFTNFGADPNVEIFTLPASVFRFYAHCTAKYPEEWLSFIHSHYHNSKFKNVKYNEISDRWETSKEVVDYDNYKAWRNYIYESLLHERSILKFMLEWSRSHKFNFKIVELYQLNVRNMDKKTIEKIKDLADFIVQNPDSGKIKKAITRLNVCENSPQFRRFLLKLIETNYADGNPYPLITAEDYAEHFFAEGSYWSETRDILLISIYQKLHELPDIIDVEPSLSDNDEILNGVEYN